MIRRWLRYRRLVRTHDAQNPAMLFLAIQRRDLKMTLREIDLDFVERMAAHCAEPVDTRPPCQ